MTLTDTPSLRFPVDADHGRLRFTVVLAFAAIWALGFFLISTLTDGGGFNLLAILGGLLLAYALTTSIERWLRPRWPSGRAVELDDDGIRLVRRGSLEAAMRADEAVNPLHWRFQVARRSRVPKGWWMVACGLETEEQYLIVYTFMSPAQFESYDRAGLFTRLVGKKEQGKTDLRLAGEQRRLRDAENYRWMYGAEMQSDDFMRYVEQVHTRYPEWMPLS
jgi:hypothetical protein